MHQFFFSEGDGVGGVGLQYTDRRLYGDQAGFFFLLSYISIIVLILCLQHMRFYFIWFQNYCLRLRVMI